MVVKKELLLLTQISFKISDFLLKKKLTLKCIKKMIFFFKNVIKYYQLLLTFFI